MGTGWRRAFCTTIPRDPEDSSQQQKTPRNGSRKLGFLTGNSKTTSNPSTPRLRCKTLAEAAAKAEEISPSPTLHCKTAPSSTSNTPRLAKSSSKPAAASNPSSPRSPLKLSIFKNSFKFRSNSCGICSGSVKTGQGMAIYTAECGHVFHFPCIAGHVRSHRELVCPVCRSSWSDVPLLAAHKNLLGHQQNNPSPVPEKILKPIAVVEKVVDSSPRTVKLAAESRCYDDDEPLLSPTAGAKFCPILEADEDEGGPEGGIGEEGEEEFQGFFVNRNAGSGSFKYSDEVTVNDIREPRQVDVRLQPESAVVSTGRGHETYAVVLKVKAPPPQTGRAGGSHRAPIDLVAVLDVSGSMTGAKLQMLKRAMRLVISSLGSSDRLSIVAFSATSKRLLALRRMTVHGQRAARRIIDRLTCGQGSGVADALKKAAKVLEDRRERNPVASIMLLSDGQDPTSQPNQRHTRSTSVPPSTRFAHIEIPVHSFGFGNKRGYSHEPAEDAFARCVGGLLSVVVQDLRIQIGITSGSAPAEIAAVYSCNGRPTALGSGSIRVGDLYAEEEREFLIELRVPSVSAGSHNIMSVRSCYKDPATQEVVYSGDKAMLVPRPHHARSSAAKVEQLRALFLSTRAIAESRRLVDHHNDLTSAHHLLASARALLIQGGGASSEATEEHVRALETELAEVYWRRQQMIQRTRAGDRGVDPMVDENGDPLTPTSAWRSAEKLAKVAMMKKSMSRVSDLHGFENARF